MMKNRVKDYCVRRYRRLLERADRADDEKGSWITTENGHKVHLNEEGQPDKGNPHVIEKMESKTSKVDLDPFREKFRLLLEKSYPSMSALEKAVEELPAGAVVSYDSVKYQKLEDGRWVDLNNPQTIIESSWIGIDLSYPGSGDSFELSFSDEKIEVEPKAGKATGQPSKPETNLEKKKEKESARSEKETPEVEGKGEGKTLEIIHPKEAFSPERKERAVWDKEGGAVADSILRPITSRIWKSLSDKERWHLYKYTSESDDMNTALRSGAPDWWGKVYTAGVQEHVDALTEAIDKSEAPQDMWIQRGVSVGGICKLFNVPEKSHADAHKLSADDFLKLITSSCDYGQDKAFMSCGSSKGSGTYAAPVLLNVYCPKGTKMLYVEPFSKYGFGGKKDWDGEKGQEQFSREDETVLQRGTMLVPRKVTKKDGRFYIDVDVIGQSY